MSAHIPSKKLQISKAQSRLILVVAIATVLTVFFLVSSKTLISEAAFQKRLIDSRRDAVKQLQENISSADTLLENYETVFEGTSPTNLIGGRKDPSPSAVPPNGTNARVVLNALPSTYDFPALITSVSKILSDSGIANPTIGGEDQSTSISSDPQANPEPASIELNIGGSSNYGGIQRLITDLERSIRPFDIQTLQFRGTDAQLFVTLKANTYYQPAKSLTIGSKEIK